MWEESFDKAVMKTGIFHGYVLTFGLAIVFQLTGQWILMILAGSIGSIFVKKM